MNGMVLHGGIKPYGATFLVFTDYARTWGTNNVVVNSNSLKYQGEAVPSALKEVKWIVNGQSNNIIYSGATKGWVPNTDEASALAPSTPAFSPTGGTITTSGLYTIHTFTTSGTFTPNISGSVDYLVVAGGGGGGYGYGGAGGAGGFLTATSFAVAATGLTVTIGAGGGGAVSNTQGGSGDDSVFSTITAAGGGGGAGFDAAAAATAGGSGGGGGFMVVLEQQVLLV